MKKISEPIAFERSVSLINFEGSQFTKLMQQIGCCCAFAPFLLIPSYEEIDASGFDNGNQTEWSISNGGFHQRIEVNRLRKRLKILVELYEDEEDDDITAISKASISNFESLLKVCKDEYFKGWNLFSNNKGALALEHKSGGVFSSIYIGDTHITYFFDNENNMTKITGQEPFNSESIETLLKKTL